VSCSGRPGFALLRDDRGHGRGRSSSTRDGRFPRSSCAEQASLESLHLRVRPYLARPRTRLIDGASV
jgi:hypothetical protein